jgi:serine protease Do
MFMNEKPTRLPWRSDPFHRRPPGANPSDTGLPVGQSRGTTAPRWPALLLACALLVAAVQTTANAAADGDVRRDATVRAIEEVMPSVVNVSTETIVEVRDPLENVFKDFFGPDWGRRSQKSLGSGVIIDEDGYVLTNLHVVRRANRITVTLADGRVFEAKPLASRLKTDVALLKLVTKGNEKFKAVRFAPDDDLLLGETVVALGNPFGLGGSVSRGILSSKARRSPIADENLNVADWLQTDAAINPGNSGGPLINLRGELIGIDVAVFKEGQGIGFAIPVKRVTEALAEIFTPEGIQSLWFGGRFQASTNGLIATVVQPESPADKAGLRPGDRILRVNEKVPQSLIELNRELISAGEKQEIRLQVQRGLDRKTLLTRLTPEKDFFNAGLIRKKLGAVLQELTPDAKVKLGLNRVQGLLFAGVDDNGPAAEAELRQGYLLQAIDGEAPENLTHAAKLLYAKRSGETVKLSLIIRRARGNFVQLVSATTEVTVR